MKKISLLVMALMIVCIMSMQKLNYKNQHQHQHQHHKLQKALNKKDKQDPINDAFRRLKSKLIDDARVTNDKTSEQKPFKVEFVKSQEDLDAYNALKNSDPVQVKFITNTLGNDQAGESFLGNFWLLQEGEGSRRLSQEYSVYLNSNALYFTERKENSADGNYRDIKGSVAIKNMIMRFEESQILKGQCCKAVSKVLFYKQPSSMAIDTENSKQIDQEFRSLMEQTYKAKTFKFNAMTCVEISYNYGDSKSQMAVCSMITNQIIQFKNIITQAIVKNVMYANHITDFAIVEQSKDDQAIAMESSKYGPYKNWSYDQQQSWPKECKQSKNGMRFKSPIIISNQLFNDFQKRHSKDDETIPNERVAVTEEDDNLIHVEFDQMIVTNEVNPFYLEEAEKNLLGDNLNKYFYHPTYSYKGLHENMILGHLGSLKLQINKYLGAPLQVNDDYFAFAIKFKVPGEHKFDTITYNGEIQVFMTRKDPTNLLKKTYLKKLIGMEKNSNVYKQFGRGYIESDSLTSEFYIDKLTDLVLAIPLQYSEGESGVNLFLHYLNHEDWFEASDIELEEEYYFDDASVVKIQNKDMEIPLIQDAKSITDEQRAVEAGELVNWEQICFPGSIKCLFEQIKTQKSLYFYQGTITTPPCKQPVDWIILKNPIKVTKDDFENLKRNVFQFRPDESDGFNVNKFLTLVKQKDLENKVILRKMDYSILNCDKTEELRSFIKNSLISTVQEKSAGQTLEDLSTQSGSIVMISQEQRQEFINLIQHDKTLSTLSGAIWENWFISSPERHYRRLYAKHNIASTIETLKKVASDAVDTDAGFEYNVDKKVSEEEEDSDDNAMVMVTGQIQTNQKVSAKNLNKVQSVIKKAKIKSEQAKTFMSEEEQKSSTFVDIDVIPIVESAGKLDVSKKRKRL